MPLSPVVEGLDLDDAAVACAHCGLHVPPGLLQDTPEPSFCCEGCRSVYTVIHGSGLHRYYHQREGLDEPRQPARVTQRSYLEYDSQTFEEAYCRDLQGGKQCAELHLSGLHCAACVWLIERAPRVVNGLEEARVDLERSRVHLVWERGATQLSEVARALDALGYPSHPPELARAREARRQEDRSLLIRMGVAGAAAGNNMLMAGALYAGLFQGMAAEYVALFRWGSLAVTVPAVLWSSGAFLRAAWAALRTRTPHMDLPISLGILVGFGWGIWGTLQGQGEIYFDSISVLIFLLLVGRWIQRRQQQKARDAERGLGSLTPALARLVEGEATREVPVEEVPLGAVVEVLASERVPVDGKILDGASSLDRSLLSGESRPEPVAPGDLVHAGCVNLASPLRVLVEKTGAETRIGRILEEVEAATLRKAPIVRTADRVSGYFVATVVLLALLTGIGWASTGMARAVDHAVALLVITCPCALGLATPLAVSVAMGRAAGRGILIKGGDVLEALAHPALIIFDKTGTLTEGRLEMLSWEGDETLKSLVRAAEQGSAHPVAQAMQEAISESPGHEVSDLVQIQGAGLEARVDGRPLRVGSVDYMRQADVPIPSWAEESVARHAEALRTPVLVALEGSVKAVAAFGDALRHDALESLERLHRMGHQIAILSGDHPAVVQALERTLPVPLLTARGGVSPEGKLAFVERAARAGSVVMVGDGVNDAAALAAATVGIAVKGGTEASLAAADVIATQSGITPVVELFTGARRCFGVIRRNIVFSVAYNLVGASLAIAGLVGPLLAALLMPLSSLTVVTSSYRSSTFKVTS